MLNRNYIHTHYCFLTLPAFRTLEMEPKDLNLKVMRISKPVLHERVPIFSEQDDDLEESDASGLSSAYLMPNSVGDFYLGEPAHFLLSIQNMSNPPIQFSDVKVTVQVFFFS